MRGARWERERCLHCRQDGVDLRVRRAARGRVVDRLLILDCDADREDEKFNGKEMLYCN